MERMFREWHDAFVMHSFSRNFGRDFIELTDLCRNEQAFWLLFKFSISIIYFIYYLLFITYSEHKKVLHTCKGDIFLKIVLFLKSKR